MTAPAASTPRAALLTDAALGEVDRIGHADLLVGIPSYNNAGTIGHVVTAVTAGLAKYFPGHSAVVVNSDGGSTDGTQDAVRRATLQDSHTILVAQPARVPERIVTAYQGMPGKGSAFRTIFEIARRLDASACAVVDSDLRSITPEWVQLLLAPVADEGFDYVAPLYSRHKYDGTITNSIVYPLVRALYGKRIRQPIGGDFGFSGRLAAHFLQHDVWDTDVARYGIDIWMTTTALTGDFLVCQSYLGAKIHDAKDPGADLSTMLRQVTGSLFRQLEQHQQFWTGVTGSIPVPEFGFKYAVGLEPVPVNLQRMVAAFEGGVREFDEIYRQFLSETTLGALRGLAGQTATQFTMPADLWVRLVYDYVAAYHHRRLNADHLLRSLTPLYLGRTAAWVVEAAPLDAGGVERALDQLSERFETLKPYLLERWHEGGKHT